MNNDDDYYTKQSAKIGIENQEMMSINFTYLPHYTNSYWFIHYAAVRRTSPVKV